MLNSAVLVVQGLMKESGWRKLTEIEHVTGKTDVWTTSPSQLPWLGWMDGMCDHVVILQFNPLTL